MAYLSNVMKHKQGECHSSLIEANGEDTTKNERLKPMLPNLHATWQNNIFKKL